MRTQLRLYLSIFFLATLSFFSVAQTSDSIQEKSLGEIARENRRSRTEASQQDSSTPTDTSVDDSGWRISPQKINVTVGHVRELQILDDLAQELHGAVWSVDNPALAEVTQRGDHVFVLPLATGTIRVSAALSGETRYRDIRIWNKIPNGTSRWGLHPIGREIGDIPAVPGDGPDIYSLEQTSSGSTYLRADSNDGMQAWTWLMPEATSNVELICGDWLGGAIIAATEADSYTLYAVGKDGTLRWRHTSPGIRKSLAIGTDHLVYLVTSSRRATEVTLTGIDGASGEIKFDLPIPSSRMIEDGIHRKGPSLICATNGSSSLLPIISTRVIVNMDGLAYIAFTQRTRTVKRSPDCRLGVSLDQKSLIVSQDDELILWQIHPDGTYRANAIETIHRKQPLSQPLTTMAPTRSLLTDNMNGTLIPIQSLRQMASGKDEQTIADFEYRVSPEGQLIYKFKMPQYTGTLHDEMVIARNNLGFATRGDTLIALDIETGDDLWHWKSSTDEIEVRAALANGHCLVQTPTALVEVADGTSSKVTAEGRFILNWQGDLLKVHH